MPKTTKVILTNRGALELKYVKNYAKVQAAIDALIAADRKRGTTTRLVELDDAATMKRFRAPRVRDVDDHEKTKHAIDTVWKQWEPDYLMILGAPDVVAHQDLLNPLYNHDDDNDRFAPSDLPYACDARYSQQIAAFTGPTRVVGRLPDLFGVGRLSYIERVLGYATRFETVTSKSYGQYFGLTALPWKKSTKMSLAKTFGDYDHIHESPSDGPGWPKAQLKARAHFINCHGGMYASYFMGQRGDKYPHSLESDRLRGKISKGTIVAAECCYGAQLFDPECTLEHDGMGICNRYLQQGAYAFFGASTIAYGPSEGNAEADLICQEFLQRVLAGASTGRAVLEARIQFIMQATHMDPANLKTLAQFNLMGDPAITVVGRAGHALDETTVYRDAFAYRAETASHRASAVGREQRRRRLIRDGSMLGKVVGTAHKSKKLSTPKHVEKLLARAVKDAGVDPQSTLSFIVKDPGSRIIGSKKSRETTPDAFHVMHGSRHTEGSHRMRHVIIIAAMQNGKVVRLRRLHRRG